MNDEDQPIPVSQVVNGRAGGRYPPGFRPPPLEKYTPAARPTTVRKSTVWPKWADTVVLVYAGLLLLVVGAFLVKTLFVIARW